MEYHNNLTGIFKEIHTSHKELIHLVCSELGHDDKAEELIKKLLDTNYSRVKIKKDPNRVRKPKTSYMFFCDEKRKTVQDENQGKKLGEISKILGSMWQNLDDNGRRRYKLLQEKDHERYEDES